MRSFSVMLINSTCVSLSWTLMDDTSVPVFMVVQWSLPRKQDWDQHRGPSTDAWVRLPYTDRPTYLRGSTSSWLALEACVQRATVMPSVPPGDFFGMEDCGFYLYPVFADGEGEPAYATGGNQCVPASRLSRVVFNGVFSVPATRGDPAIYVLLMIISFLSIVLLVSLILSQNQ